MGFREKEVIRQHIPIEDATIVDVGCGIGRLTRYLAREPIARYFGLDIVPEILDEARTHAPQDRDFSFHLVDTCSIPIGNTTADCVVGFSLITHLMDEEIFEYFSETCRVLKNGGKAIFSFLDFSHPTHKAAFAAFAKRHRSRADVLRFTEKTTLATIANLAGLNVGGFLDSGTKIPRQADTLFDGRPAPDQIEFWQSVAIFEKPLQAN